MPPPRSAPVWLAPRWRSRSTASYGTSSRPLPGDNGDGPPKLEIITERSGDEALALIRHDAAHVLATAMLDLYPGVKISIGPAIDNGFYYDFEFPEGVDRQRFGLRADRGRDASPHQRRRAVRA